MTFHGLMPVSIPFAFDISSTARLADAVTTAARRHSEPEWVSANSLRIEAQPTT